MRDITDLTTDEKTHLNKFFDVWMEHYDKHAITQLRNISALFFIYNHETKEYLSFGKDLNEAIKNALTWTENAPDINVLLEHLNQKYEFIFINLTFKPTLH